MEMHHCWRCERELPFLDEVEYEIISSMIGIPATVETQTPEWELLNQIPLDIFESITGYKLICRFEIHHHRRSLLGRECSGCGYLLRTPKASLCANCGLAATQTSPSA